MRGWVIYILCDPDTDEIRYVGATHNPRTRLAEHICTSKREHNHRGAWIRSLLKRGVRPLLKILEEGSGEGWQEAEQRWIAHHRALGTRLVNATDGGEGTLGWNPSAEQRAEMARRATRVHTGRKRFPEARANMSRAQRERIGVRRPRPPRTDETRARMSKAQKGKKASEETRRRLSEAHRNPTEETREKLRKAGQKRPVEQRDAFASNQRGVPKSEEHKKRIAEALPQAWVRRKGLTHG